MNKKEHINNTILDFDTTLNILFDEYELDISLPIEKCLSNESIKDIIPTEENTIFDKLDSVYYKGIKDLFRTLKKVDRLGAPKFHYYKDNTIKVTSSLIENYKLDGHVDNLYNFKTTYLSRLKEFLEGLSPIKYIQYLVNIEGLILELGEPKLTIDGANIILRYPFDIENIDETVENIKEEFKNLINTIKYKKIEKSLVCVQIIKLIESANQNRVKGNLLENKIEFEKDLLAYSKEMEGNIQITSDNEYLILSNKGLIYNKENLKTINSIVSEKYKEIFLIGIGIGEGATIHQSEKNARNALKLSVTEGKNNIYFYDGLEIKGPLMNEKEIKYINFIDKDIADLSKKIGISSSYIEKIKSIMKKLEKNTFTSEDLAGFLNITERSVNRLLKKIIENGYGEENKFENPTGAGRPRRIIKINF